MEEKILKQSIDRLDITDNATQILKNNNVKNIGQLCKKSKTDLKNIQLVQNEISKIEIELQLLGLNLRNSL